MPDPVTQLKDTTGNPAPLGLLGFGMTTVLLNCHNAGFFPLNTMILSMGIFYGGIAQVIAGIMEWKKGSTFAGTAFISYGFFWLSLVGFIYLPLMFPGVASATGPVGAGPAGPNGAAFSTYLALWGIFTFVMFIGTFKLSKALQFVFGTLTLLFFLLAYLKAGNGGEGLEHATGIEGIVCGAAAMYTGLAQVLNELYGKTILPLGAPAPKA
jgi:succinate-acetate transporter protein